MYIYRLRFPAVLAFVAAVLLSGCKEAEQVQAEHAAALQKLAELRAEFDGLELKLADLRKAIPPGATPEDSARRMTVRLQTELEQLDQQLVTATREFEDADAGLTALREQTERLKKQLVP